MLLGKDDVILDVAPTYVTDAIVRKVNADRYDDREIIKTNLVESYNQLLEFGRKNLPDKFFLEDTVNKSLRNTIVREMVSNTLMHREFTSSYTAKFVIEKDRMYVENANRATKEGFITVDNLEPNSKNPIIAVFFRNIGYADQLGSGVRKLFKYSKYYSGKDPQFVEDDVFRIIVPLDDTYSFDYGIENSDSKVIEINNADKMPINYLSAQQSLIIEFANGSVIVQNLVVVIAGCQCEGERRKCKKSCLHYICHFINYKSAFTSSPFTSSQPVIPAPSTSMPSGVSTSVPPRVSDSPFPVLNSLRASVRSLFSVVGVGLPSA